MFVSGFGSALALGITSLLTEGIQIPHGAEQLWPLLGLTLCLQVIASLYSYFIFSEVLTAREVLGIAIVIVGVYLVKAQYSNKIKK